MLLRKRNPLFLGVLGLSSIVLSLSPLWSDIHKMLSNAGKIVSRRNVYPRFVLGTNDDGRELNVEAKELMDKRSSDQDIPFNSVTVKWGYRKLEENDMLISMCEKDAYYLAKHVWGNQYKLDNGEKFEFPKECCSSNGNKAKYIDVKFNKTNGEGSGNSKLAITLKNCSFKWKRGEDSNLDNWTLTMTCKGEKIGNGRTNGDESITLTMNINDYKLEYNPERKSQIQEIPRR